MEESSLEPTSTKNPGGRPSGQFADRCDLLLQALRIAGSCELTDAEIGERLGPYLPGEKPASARQVRRWLGALVAAGEAEVVQIRYRVRDASGLGKWTCRRRVVAKDVDEPKGGEAE